MFTKEKYLSIVEDIETIKEIGRVTEIKGLIIESDGPEASIGDLCYIYKKNEDVPIWSEVVGFKEGKILLMPLGAMDGIQPGAIVLNTGEPMKLKVGNNILGRVLDGLGNPIDNLGEISAEAYVSTSATPINPLKRARIDEPLSLGIKSIDGFITVGKGQRLGILQVQV